MKKKQTKKNLSRLHIAIMAVAAVLFVWWMYPYVTDPIMVEPLTVNKVTDGDGNPDPGITDCGYRTVCNVRVVKQGKMPGRRIVCSKVSVKCAPQPTPVTPPAWTRQAL